ncbi:hypothetical protein K449DRAFT_442613 [Hypoxylon sp. EC38]|nr:hypothetical protein K449DRAFT_442613 [Hypoxylon sp. EC38]
MAEQSRSSHEALGDIREKYSGNEYAQNFVLSTHYPVPYDGSFKVDDEDINALDAVIVVLRHLFAQVSPEGRSGSDGNPLEKMIWAILADPSNMGEQSVERIRILRRFYDQLPSMRCATFYNIMENRLMWDTLWKRPAFMFWHPQVIKIVESSDNFEIVGYSGDDKELAQAACFEYDGRGTLSELISGKLGTKWNDERKASYHWQLNYPVIIRVIYEHMADNEEPKTFKDLAHLSINPHRIKEKEEDGEFTYDYNSEDLERVAYVLVAAVHCNDHNDYKDRIRLYRITGQPIGFSADTVGRFGGGKWKFGEPTSRYMMYYAITPKGVPTGVTEEEIAPRHLSPSVLQTIRGVMRSRGDQRGSPAASVSDADTRSPTAQQMIELQPRGHLTTQPRTPATGANDVPMLPRNRSTTIPHGLRDDQNNGYLAANHNASLRPAPGATGGAGRGGTHPSIGSGRSTAPGGHIPTGPRAQSSHWAASTGRGGGRGAITQGANIPTGPRGGGSYRAANIWRGDRGTYAPMGRGSGATHGLSMPAAPRGGRGGFAPSRSGTRGRGGVWRG